MDVYATVMTNSGIYCLNLQEMYTYTVVMANSGIYCLGLQ